MFDYFIFDISRSLRRIETNNIHPTGIDRVEVNYANYFLKKYTEKTYFISSYNHNFPNYEKNEYGYGIVKNDYVYDKIRESGWFENIDFNLKKNKCKKNIDLTTINGRGLYINVSHQNLGDNKLFRFLQKSNNLDVYYYIHDLIPIEFPEYTRKGDDFQHAMRMLNVHNTATYIGFNSKFTQQSYNSFLIDNGCKASAQEYIYYIGVEDHLVHNKEKKKLNLNNFFLYVSTIEPRKNHKMLLDIYVDAERNKDFIFPLVIVGKRGWMNKDVFHFLDNNEIIKKKVIELKDVSDAELNYLYKNARAVISPSFSEGWGMPLAEGLANETAVICSDISAHREVTKGKATYIKPNDYIEWYKMLLRYSNSDLSINDEINYISYTWNDHFRNFEKTVIKGE